MKFVFTNLGAIIEESIRVEFLAEIFEKIGQVSMVVDLGCGNRPYRRLYRDYCDKSVGIDLPDSPFPNEHVDVYASATDFARTIGLESADLIICTEVLHDVQDPVSALNEIYSALKPGGYLVLTTPFMVPICDGDFDHYRYTRYGLKYLIEKSGLEICAIWPLGDLLASTIQFISKPQLRFWHWTKKASRVKLLYSSYNPFILFFVVIPQLVYLLLRSIGSRNRQLKNVFRAFNYGAIGYVSYAIKPNETGHSR